MGKLKWYVEWDTENKWYTVKKDGFCDSHFDNFYEAQQRRYELDGGDLDDNE